MQIKHDGGLVTNNASTLNWSSIRDQFDLDELGGFIAICKEPIKRLPILYEPWEIIADDLVAFTLMDRLRSMVDNLPLLDAKLLISSGELYCQRALVILSCITHCYVRGNLIQAAKDVRREEYISY